MPDPEPGSIAEVTQEPIDLPIGCTVGADDTVLLPDGVQIGALVAGARDLIAVYLAAIDADELHPSPPPVIPEGD